MSLSSYDIGQVVRVTASFTDIDDAAADPETVTAEQIDPSGTTTALTVVKDSAGKYHADIAIPLEAASAGVWYFRFESTTPAAGADGRFRVRESAFYT